MCLSVYFGVKLVSRICYYLGVSPPHRLVIIVVVVVVVVVVIVVVVVAVVVAVVAVVVVVVAAVAIEVVVVVVVVVVVALYGATRAKERADPGLNRGPPRMGGGLEGDFNLDMGTFTWEKTSRSV